MAVAPVTDWRFYDSVYTEKYMGLPKATDNLQAYKDSNISAHASGLHNTKFLLVQYYERFFAYIYSKQIINVYECN
ncbi:dipeptidyl peptidase 4-like [Lytechinus pictus]|uniref:dipeptidyl peptidase 4-like n=1 Tax=Lytechinus pictus TaxID=7653 RepID=UPI0030BA0DCB